MPPSIHVLKVDCVHSHKCCLPDSESNLRGFGKSIIVLTSPNDLYNVSCSLKDPFSAILPETCRYLELVLGEGRLVQRTLWRWTSKGDKRNVFPVEHNHAQ